MLKGKYNFNFALIGRPKEQGCVENALEKVKDVLEKICGSKSVPWLLCIQN